MKTSIWIQLKRNFHFNSILSLAVIGVISCSSVESTSKSNDEKTNVSIQRTDDYVLNQLINENIKQEQESDQDVSAPRVMAEMKEEEASHVVMKSSYAQMNFNDAALSKGISKVSQNSVTSHSKLKPLAGKRRSPAALSINMASSMGAAQNYSMIMPPQQPIEFQHQPMPGHNTDEYSSLTENPFKSPLNDPLSTFSIDVDNASYSHARRMLNRGQTLPEGSVRVEEMINYFDYSYPAPQGKHPFSIISEVAQSPWNSANKLVHIGIQGKTLDYDDVKASNLVFLLDVSGSMNHSNKLPLLKRSLAKLLTKLGPQDRVAIVAYAGAAGLVLPSTPASQRQTILNSLNHLKAGGSTAGGAGIQLAYDVALKNLIEDGNNRVILATDGDFNVGTSSSADLVNLIKSKRDQDIFLTICGFGMGNYKDGRMEEISNAGNGNYFYIDNDKEADKVFVREMRANMFTIAKDVKIQVEFNPQKVAAYRLIGYVNRKLNKEDFNNDKKDAGELGAGHTVTALYEITPVGSETTLASSVDPLKYQRASQSKRSNSGELMTLKFRYKEPKETKSKLIVTNIKDQNRPWEKMSPDFRFSAAVAAFGMKVSHSKHIVISWNQVHKMAQGALDQDQGGDRTEFLKLVSQAQSIYPEQVAAVIEKTNYNSRQVH